MAEESYDVGGAIGLQTRATPYRGAPITQGIHNIIQNDLRAAAMEAKAAAAKKAEADKLLTLMNYETPKVHRQLQEKMTELGKKTTLGILQSKSLPEAYTHKDSFKKEAAILASDSDHLNKLETEVNNPLLFNYEKVRSAVKAGTLEGREDALNSITEPERELLGSYLDIDKSIPGESLPITQPLKKVNIADHAAKRIAALTGIADPSMMSKVDKEQIAHYHQIVNKKTLLDAADYEITNDPDLVTNVIGQNMEKALEIAPKYQNLPPDQKRRAVATELLADTYSDASKIYDRFLLKNLNNEDESNDGFTVKKLRFNPSVAEPAQNIDAYVKAGVISESQAEQYRKARVGNPTLAAQFEKNLETIPSLDAPNKGTFTVKDENGEDISIDNVKSIYVPRTVSGTGGQWFVAGTKKEGNELESVYIPINEKTYGNLFSIFPKLSADDITKLLNNRLDKAGIKGQRFTLNLNAKKPKEQTNPATKSTKQVVHSMK